ncbi:TPR end-of-group domain-containing protein [Frateuria soli]|uniref:TPR end-of-group domain-containing protein n=1 Tax=Frateuria soli TaxID=1542730 RepID=UPI001E519E22|nr:winged helix-turn-helix domain-containing protein [Frateuria soli]UGB37213.1 winged helix-turn-helix domain-containing protein [Frateuria soli]
MAPESNSPRVDYAFGDIRVEPVAHRVLRDGRELELEPKAYAVLLQFLTRPGELIKHDDLLERVWGHKYVTPATLSRVISQLRQKLGDEAAEPRYIQTVHGLGYRLIASVAADPADPAPRAGMPAPPRPPDSDRHSIAVLPFVNMSGEVENEYFSDGIAEEILSLLSKLPQLKVSSRTSSFFFKGKEADLQTIAAKLDVGTVLEGSVRRAGNRVRITAQLIDVASDATLWAETYDRELRDVFAIQDDIAQSIVDALKVTLSPKERRAIQYVATADVQAYDYYLRGRRFFYAWNRRDSLRAIEMYERAIARDPKYAAAWAGLSDAYVMRHRFLDRNPEHVARAMEASERALQMDPDSAEAHASRGLALFISQRYQEAERQFETAMMLNPNLLEGCFMYGMICSSMGNFEKAAWLYLRAAEVSPTDYLPLVYLAQAYSEMGRKDDETKTRHRALELIERALGTNPDDARARYMGAASFAALGEKAKAIEWANLALRSSQDEPMVFYNAACTFAVLGEHERAIDLLERAVALGWGDRAWMENDSDLASLRGERRFQALLDSLN